MSMPTFAAPTRGGFILDPTTGRAIGSLPDIIVREAMAGGASKTEVLDRVVARWQEDHPDTGRPHIRSVFYSTLSAARSEHGFVERWSMVPGGEAE